MLYMGKQSKTCNRLYSRSFTFIFLNFLLLCTLCPNVNTISIQEKTSLMTQELSLNHFSNHLRLKHLNNISLVDNYLTSLAQINIAPSSDSVKEIKRNLKKLFRNVGESIDEVKEGFKDNYEFCTNKLKAFSQQCSDPLEELKQNVEHNKLYAESVNKLNDQYDQLINHYYDANIYSVASNVCGGDKDITEKNDVVGLYTGIAKHLDQHFHIFKSEDMEKILLQVDSSNTKKQIYTDHYVNQLVVHIHGNSNDQLTEDDPYTTQRKNLAQILFNKVSNYMNNAIERKTKLLSQSSALFEKMKKSDLFVKNQIEKLKKGRKDNSELAYSLHKENTLTIKKMRKCENLKNLNSKCEESGNLFHSILNSYEKQSDSLQKLYNLIKKN
jgi:biotin-(acetyl-CoA carboxylase) ligase